MAKVKKELFDLSSAQLEPYRSFHYFHEHLNVHIKTSIASCVLLIDHTGRSSDRRELGNLIRASHPAWNMPPIHEVSVDQQKRMYAGVSSFAVVALFSALDDFINGVESDLSRAEEFGVRALRVKRESGDSDDRLMKVYGRYGWNAGDVSRLVPLLRYFRLIRDCIAHRSSRASEALVEASREPVLAAEFAPLLERTTRKAPSFAYDEDIFLDPTLAITCSDVLRKFAGDCNRRFIEDVGEEGFLRLVAHNLMFSDRPVRTDAYKTPEAVLNLALTERYRVPVSDRLAPAAALKRLGVWKDFSKAFEREYR